MFRPVDTSIYGGNQARAIAGQQQRSQQAREGMADFESNLTRQDLQVQRQGEQQFAETRTKQRQTEAQRDAAIEQTEMQYQAELDSRRRQLGSTVANLAGTVAGSFLGPAGAAAGGAIAGGLVGGGSGAVTGAGAGFSTAFQRQQSEDFINQLTGESEQDQPDVSNLLGDTARSSVQTERSQELIQPDMSGIDREMNLGQPMQTPQQQQPQQSDSGFSVENLFDVGQYDLRQYQQDVGFEGMTDQPQVQQPEEELSFEEINQALVGSELEMARGTGVGRTLTDMFMGGLIGVDTEGTRYSTSVADILRSPFDVFAPAVGEFVGEQLIQQKQQAQERRQRVIERLLQE